MNKKDIINSIFYPRKSLSRQDDRDVLISVEKGIEVGVRLFLDNLDSPIILYFHGNAELAEDYDSIATTYNSYGLNLIVADYRGYGLSGGVPELSNLHHDAIVIFDYILLYLKKHEYSGKIIVMGRSLGSASALEIASKRFDLVSKCIIESGFATEYPILSLMNINPQSINYSLSDGFENLSKLKHYKKPIYFIHADQDHIIPFSEAEFMLKESVSIKKDLFIVNGANHNNIIMISKESYFQKIKNFIYEE
tara:strand:- start:560 stop:1312 length:753 start_codon:yes stop_codon:yes gene_type:complete